MHCDPANVDQRPPLLLPLHFFLSALYDKSLNDLIFFPRVWMFRSAAPRGNIEILGKQN